MKNIGIYLLPLLIFSCNKNSAVINRGMSLFPIIYEGKYGFIDSSGNVIIEPQFLAVGGFTEGLAFARIKGTYGYIDFTGEFVIPPQFDYATPFSEGIAIVYSDGKPFYIDLKGQKVFESEYADLGPFMDGRAIVKTNSRKFGVINKQGELTIDTLYSRISPFVNNQSIVDGIEHLPYGDSYLDLPAHYETGVIDTLGNFIIPYGKYWSIQENEEGCYIAETIIQNDEYDFLTFSTTIGPKGEIIYQKDNEKCCVIVSSIGCNQFRIYKCKYWVSEKDSCGDYVDKMYHAYTNLNGDIFFKDTVEFNTIADFTDNRAFVTDDKNMYSIIDTRGNYIVQNRFDEILGQSFKDGVAFVAVDSLWGLIDTNAQFIIKPQFDLIHRMGIVDDYFFFSKIIPDDEFEYVRLTGVASRDGEILIKPIIQEHDYNGFINGLLRCQVDGEVTYLNKKGKKVWQEKSGNHEDMDFNIDVMNRGYFYAYTLNNKESGGWAISGNQPNRILEKNSKVETDLNVFVDTKCRNTYAETYSGITAYIRNASSSAYSFAAQDSRLYAKVQALDKKGEWKDIEYLPSSWCGNSYHKITLLPGFYWEFTIPKYQGDFTTKMRIELSGIYSGANLELGCCDEHKVIYSNEFIASINPGQLWRKRDYIPNSFMDPYFD
jgi:hypothetical protein